MFRRFALMAIVATVVAGPRPASAVSDPCQNAIGRATVTYATKRLRIISGCEDKRSAGTLPQSVVCRPQCAGGLQVGRPCRTDGDCPSSTCSAISDATTSGRINAAIANATSQVSRRCPGALPPLGPACDSATNAATLASCLTAALQDSDVEPINVDTLAGTLYDTTAPVADAGLRKCQKQISRQVGTYLSRRLKAVQTCEMAVARGSSAGPCPDAKARTKMESARTNMDTKIRKSCSETQLAASSPNPHLDFGLPCESYKLMIYSRGVANANTVPVLDRFMRCATDAAAGVADRMIDVPFVGADPTDFDWGVAAGDASPTGAIFWTKLPDPNSGAFLHVTTDNFATLVGGSPVAVTSPPGTDGTVKQEVALSPGTIYNYRFQQSGQFSRVGRLVTPPLPATTAPVRIGWSGDANAFFRPYTSLDPVRALNPDAWFFIGDTIYGDDPRSGTGDAMVLADYFAKYRENRADAALRDIMATAGTYSQWDDHEVRNDFSGAEPVFASRLVAGNFAFRRYNPMREDTGDPMRLYRSAQWGSLAEFFMIDGRQYRSAKYTCCNTAAESGFVTNDDDTTCHTSGEALVPSAACNTFMNSPTRTVLGAAQKQWLKDGLMNSTATFKFIMNGTPITQLLFQPYDRWEAYTAERTEILDFILNNSLKNVIWLSTDLHGIVISPDRVDVANTHPVPEIVAGAIGMDPIFRELPPSVVPLLPSLPAILTQIGEFDIDRFNIVMISVDDGVPPKAKFDFYDRSGAIIHTVSFDAVP
jgi:phosphodiesterase/alkaline phosphatase D-like protein